MFPHKYGFMKQVMFALLPLIVLILALLPAMQSTVTSNSTSNSIYSLTINFVPNTGSVLFNGSIQQNGNVILVQGGNYPINAIAPANFIFGNWQSSANVSVASSTSANTILSLTGNGVITADFNSITVFSENGLPSNALWGVTYDNMVESSTANTIIFVTWQGSHAFTVQNVITASNAIYTPNPSNGNVIAGNASIITFTSAPSAATILNLTTSFSENGLPDNAVWSVTFNSVSREAQAPNVIAFNTISGNYPFSVSNVIIANAIYVPSQNNGYLIAGNTTSIVFSVQSAAVSTAPTSTISSTTTIPPTSQVLNADNGRFGGFVRAYNRKAVLNIENSTLHGIAINFTSDAVSFNVLIAIKPSRNSNFYSYITINESNSTVQKIDDYVRTAVYNFSVPASWINKQGIGSGNIKLFKQTGGGLMPLPTMLLGYNSIDGSYYYSAISNSLSTYAVGFTTGNSISTTSPLPLTLTSGYKTYFWAGGFSITDSHASPYGSITTNWANTSLASYAGKGKYGANVSIGYSTGNAGTITVSTGTADGGALVGIGANVIFTSNNVNGAVYTTNTGIDVKSTATSLTLPYTVTASNSFVILLGVANYTFPSPTLPSGCTLQQDANEGTYAQAFIANCIVSSSNSITISPGVASSMALAAFVFPPYTVTLDDNPSAGGSVSLGGSTYTNGQAAQIIGTTTLNAIAASGYAFSSWSVSNSNASIASSSSANTFVTIEGNTVITASYIVPAPPCLTGTAPSTVPSGLAYYSELCLQNSQSSATGNNFQEEINLTESNAIYGSYIAYNGVLANFEYFYSNGTIAPAWIEGNSLGKLTTWMELNPSIAGSSDYNSIYVGFASASTNLLSSSGTSGIGEAPNITTTYAQYDDGRKVFPFYDNFAGTTLNSTLWTASTSNYTVSNGLTMEASTTASYNVTTVSQTYNSDMITELYANASESLTGGSIGISWSFNIRAPLPTASYLQTRSSWSTPGAEAATELSGTQSKIWESKGGGSIGMQFYSEYSTSAAAYSSMGKVYPYNSINGSSSTSDVYYSPNGAELQIQDLGTGLRWYVQYARQRVPPPNNVMPSAVFGTVTATSSPSCTITLPTSAINFGNINPETSINTINSIIDDNVGTAQAYMLVYGGNWIGPGSNTFGVSNTSWSGTNNVAYNSANLLSATAANTLLAVPAAGSNTIYFGIKVAGGAPSGTYSQTITLENTC